MVSIDLLKMLKTEQFKSMLPTIRPNRSVPLNNHIYSGELSHIFSLQPSYMQLKDGGHFHFVETVRPQHAKLFMEEALWMSYSYPACSLP